jgi:hypothetical protein
MKQTIVLFFLLFFCVIAQAADKVPMTARQPIKPQIRAVAPADIKFLGYMIARGESKEAILGKWKAMLVGTNDRNLDINTLVQSVMRASYQQQEEELNTLKDKVQYNNEMKKKIRDEQDKARKAIITPGSSPMIRMNIAIGRGTPIIIFPQKSGIEQERQDYLRYLKDKLNAVGDDAQMANTDLQNALQKQQQLVTMMSNIGKLLNDTAMDTVRKMGD